MELPQDREVFVNGHGNYKDTKKAERAAFYDFCAKYEGDELPPPKELAEAFNVTPNTIRIWAGKVGVPYPLRGIDSAKMFLDRAVKYLQELQGTTTINELLKGAKLSYYAYDYYNIRNRLQKYYPELVAKIKATKAGRPIGKAGSSQKKGSSYHETQRARKRKLNALNEGTGRNAIRIAEALADALDRKVTFKELAIASRIAEPSLRRFALSLFGSRLTQFVDFNAPADAPPALSYNGDFVEGAGEFEAPAEWQKAVTERGHLGVNLTGGYFRRYLVMYLHRLRGMTYKAGKFVPLATPPARKGAILD